MHLNSFFLVKLELPEKLLSLARSCSAVHSLFYSSFLLPLWSPTYSKLLFILIYHFCKNEKILFQFWYRTTTTTYHYHSFHVFYSLFPSFLAYCVGWHAPNYTKGFRADSAGLTLLYRHTDWMEFVNSNPFLNYSICLYYYTGNDKMMTTMTIDKIWVRLFSPL